jgi:hypothetical protein
MSSSACGVDVVPTDIYPFAALIVSAVKKLLPEHANIEGAEPLTAIVPAVVQELPDAICAKASDAEETANIASNPITNKELLLSRMELPRMSPIELRHHSLPRHYSRGGRLRFRPRLLQKGGRHHLHFPEIHF